jgi:hypothetical protein
MHDKHYNFFSHLDSRISRGQISRNFSIIYNSCEDMMYFICKTCKNTPKNALSKNKHFSFYFLFNFRCFMGYY